MESAKDVGKNVEVNEYQEALFKIRKSRVIEKSVGGVFSNYEILSIEEVLEEESNLLKELVDKATPKKPIVEVKETKYKKSTIHEHIPHCPICNTRLFLIGACCPNNECRQAIDWSKDER